MKICILSTSLSCHRKGGTEAHAELLAERAALKGHDVTVLTCTHPSGIPEEEKRGIRIRYLEGTNHAMSRKDMGIWREASANALTGLISEGGEAVVWAENLSGLGYASSPGKPGKAPLISIMQGPGIAADLKSKWEGVSGTAETAQFFFRSLPQALGSYLPWLKRVLAGSDAVVAVSEYARASIISEFPAAAPKTRVIHNGIETGLFRPDRKKREMTRCSLGFSSGDKVIVMAGVLGRQKGFHLGLSAFMECLRAVPAARLLIAGEGPERKALETEAGRLGLEKKTLFYGGFSRDRLPALLAASDVFLNPTLRGEGLPLAVAEAMAAGLPCVLSAAGGSVETAVEGESGFFFRPGDVHGAGKALTALLTDRELCRRMGGAARERAAREFDADKMTDAYINLSLGLLGCGPGGPICKE